MPLPIGTRIGPYEIVGVLGAGGMGEVYRAHDARLGRDVALKVLPENLAADPERLARFQREAQVLASLKHPNIGAIYGLEANALVLELVEGETLADHIARGPIPVDEALPMARQIAEALQAAHEQGIIHRDLKPANIKIQPDGTVKVLDFGLAKLNESGGSHVSNVSNAISMSPTIMSPAATGLGVILGTAAYMAPEQAKGRPADKRSDVWAFGCVLYEMLIGKRAFEGDDVSDTLAMVLKGEPDWQALPTETPSAIRVLLTSCLAKDRRRRPGDVSAALFALDNHTLLGSTIAGHSEISAPRQRWRWAITPVAAALIVGGAAGYAAWTLKPAALRPVSRFSIPLPGGQEFSNTGRDVVALSPDGRYIAYTANRRIYVRPIDQLEATEIRGTEGVDGGPFANTAARNPAFSPDGRWLAFWKEGQLKKVAISGGAPVVLCAVEDLPWSVTWSADDTILYSMGPKGVWRVSAAGGKPDQLIKLAEGRSAHGPQILPGGHSVLFTVVNGSNFDDAQIVVQSLETGERRVVINGGTDAHYVSTGHLVYVQRGVLLAIPFDPTSLTVTGGPVSLVEDVGQSSNPTATGAGHFSISDMGTLVYVPASALAATTSRTLTWVDRAGREEPIKVPPRFYVYPRLSPDGARVALDIRDQQNDIWIADPMRGTLTRLTFDPGFDRSPVWMPDGKRIVFSSQTGGDAGNLFRQLADGAGAAERLTTAPVLQYPTDVSPDGKFVIGDWSPGAPQPDEANAPAQLDEAAIGTARAIFKIALDGEHRAQPLLQSQFVQRNGTVSSDGRWLAYESNSSGQFEVYVRPFPDVGSAQWQISTSGGTRPLWARNGRELFYVAATGAIMSVPIDPGSSWKAGTPAQVVAPTYITLPPGTAYRTYDVSPDGKRFLVIKSAQSSDASTIRPRMIVVQNWFEELKRRVPAH